MKLVHFLSVGLIALPLASCLPVERADAEVAPGDDGVSVFEYGTYKKREAEEDTPSIFGYLYKKSEAEEDTPSIFGYLYKKREAEEDTPSIFGYLYKKREAEEDAPNVFEYGTYKE